MTPSQQSDVHIVIPAAGASSRLGVAKQNIAVHDKPLWRHTLDKALSLNCPVSLVTGCWSPNESIPQGVNLLHCPDWQQGLGNSIAFGVSNIVPPSKGYLILLIDQWRLTGKALYEFMQQWDGKQIQVAKDLKYTGPPVLFPAHFRQQLSTLSGTKGAQKLLHEQRCHVVAVKNARWDLDTPQDLTTMQELINSNKEKEEHYDLT
ncbi:NTP transferase domain-containing protein [Reinekea sp. G2M2-21]|uniref:nucleotidyltransferase family protein n=1 Tax=Reinekea sp. G2M2-21 TaxID=2788942 RepID=UPI0018AAEE34|nr:nucleotidyltransferase family protein [Reinekea sp. G2M2-21]